MTNYTFLLVSLLVVFSFSSLDVGLASHRGLQASPNSPPDAKVQQTLTEIESLLKQIHSLLQKNEGAAPSFNSAAFQQTMAQLKSVIERNRALLPKDDISSPKLSSNSRRLFAESPEESTPTMTTSGGVPVTTFPPLSSLPKFPHLPDEYNSKSMPIIPGINDAQSPNGNPSNTPSGAPSPSPSKKPQGFFAKLFHF